MADLNVTSGLPCKSDDIENQSNPAILENAEYYDGRLCNVVEYQILEHVDRQLAGEE